MPSNHKVYQKKTTVKEKTALMKIFFWSLCAISLFISRLKTFSWTLGKVVLRHGCPVFQSGCGSLHYTPAFFSFISLCRVRLCWRATGAAQRGSRQGGGPHAWPPALRPGRITEQVVVGNHRDTDVPRDSI